MHLKCSTFIDCTSLGTFEFKMLKSIMDMSKLPVIIHGSIHRLLSEHIKHMGGTKVQDRCCSNCISIMVRNSIGLIVRRFFVFDSLFHRQILLYHFLHVLNNIYQNKRWNNMMCSKKGNTIMLQCLLVLS